MLKERRQNVISEINLQEKKFIKEILQSKQIVFKQEIIEKCLLQIENLLSTKKDILKLFQKKMETKTNLSPFHF